MATARRENARANNLAVICAAKKYTDYVSFKLGQPQPQQSSKAAEEELKSVIENYRWNLVRVQLSDMCRVAVDFAGPNLQATLWKQFFQSQQINLVQFAKDIYTWLSMSDFKRNTLFLKGPTNCGKSMLVNCICAPFVPAFLSGLNKNQSEFVFMPALTSDLVVLEELFLTVENVNDFKRLMEGGKMEVHMKFNAIQCLGRRPVIATSQYNTVGHGYLPSADELAIKNRSFEYKLTTPFKSHIKLTAESFWSVIVSHWHVEEKRRQGPFTTPPLALC